MGSKGNYNSHCCSYSCTHYPNPLCLLILQIEEAENDAKSRAAAHISLYASFPSRSAMLAYQEKLAKDAMHKAAVARSNIVQDRIASDSGLLDAVLSRWQRGESIMQGINLPNSLSNFISRTFESMNQIDRQSPVSANHIDTFDAFHPTSSLWQDLQMGTVDPFGTDTAQEESRTSTRSSFSPISPVIRNEPLNEFSSPIGVERIQNRNSTISQQQTHQYEGFDPNELGLSEEELHLARLAQENYDITTHD